jgi:AraC family transcriptional regulator
MSKNDHVELTDRANGGAIDLDNLKRKSWPTIAAQYVRIPAPTAYDFKLTKSSNYFALHDIYRVDGETSVTGLPRSYRKDLRSKIAFLPSGGAIDGWSQIAKPASFVAAYIDQTAEDKDPIDLERLPPQLHIEDHMLRSALSRFQLLLHYSSLDTPGYAETLAMLMTYEMARLSSRQRLPVAHKGGLTARQVRLVVDYIESHLTEKTTISELAALLDLTRFHFIRTFKQVVGMPPHKFMVLRRIDRAKELLERSEISVSEVAAQSGFNSVTQLTKAFRRVVGVTPSSFRRDLS